MSESKKQKSLNTPDPANALNITSADGESLPQPEVPVFRCVVYVRTLESGQVHAMVANLPANLPGLEITAGSERSALQRIVPAFKQRVIEFKQKGESIPWIDPPTEMQPDQDKRAIPVHL